MSCEVVIQSIDDIMIYQLKIKDKVKHFVNLAQSLNAKIERVQWVDNYFIKVYYGLLTDMEDINKAVINMQNCMMIIDNCVRAYLNYLY